MDPNQVSQESKDCFSFELCFFNPTHPSYLKKIFEFLRTYTDILSSSENLMQRIPGHLSKFFEHFYSFQATKVWNILPIYIKHSKSFKNI